MTEQKSLEDDAKAKAKNYFRIVRDAREKLGINEPSPYFAVLAADGDRMGELISNIVNRESHIKLSAALACFSNIANEVVREYRGVLVYSGGDDVLAFLPLDMALECAKRLHEEFNKAIAPHSAGGIIPSLSVGISVAHYSEHLQNLLQWARDAEKAAKNVDGKDALAVHLHTRTAGEMFIGSVHHWIDDPVLRWERWISLLVRDAIPKATAYDLRTLARESKGTTLATNIDLLKKETKRILDRKHGEHGATSLTEADKDYILECCNGLEDLRELVNEIIIARHFAKVRQIAVKGDGQK